MYCCWLGKAVVHVPTGGILKRIVIFPSTGEGIVLISDCGVMGGGYCPFVTTGERRTKLIAERRAAGNRCQNRCENQPEVL